MSEDEIKVLDTSGLLCPEPLMLLHKEIRLVAKGERIRVISTDPSTERDIPKFCTYLGHALISHQASDNKYTYEIEKA